MIRWFCVLALVPLVLAPACTHSAGAVAPPRARTRTIDARLPELPCDARTLQLAKQARRVARQGKCDASRRTMDRIRERDPRYASALLASEALGSCRHVPALRSAPGASTPLAPIAPPAT